MGLIIIFIVIVLLAVAAALLISANQEHEEDIELERKSLRRQFGKITSKCMYDSVYNDGGIILANIEEDKILIGKLTYKISDIEKCEFSISKPKAYTTYSEKTVISTNTANAVGRAVAGGILAGGLGAVIGGATAKKEIKTVRTPHTTYTDESYLVQVDIKGWNQGPLLKTRTAEDAKRVCDFINDLIMVKHI